MLPRARRLDAPAGIAEEWRNGFGRIDTETHLPWSVRFEDCAVLALACDLWFVNAEKLMAELDSEQNKRTEGDWNGLPFCWRLPRALELVCRVSRALPQYANDRVDDDEEDEGSET